VNGLEIRNPKSVIAPSMTAPAAATGMRLGDLLLKEGLISREQLDKALLDGKQNGTRLGYALVKLGYVTETDITKMLARQFRMPAVGGGR
jgi:type IV pilus assembly protein PilB